MYPDFLCIGAQKSGTSWLDHNLRTHPQIWLPPIKELHYFDRRHSTLRERLFGKVGCYRAARRATLKRLARVPSLSASRELRWLARYLCCDRSDRWYASLFPLETDRLRGEMTPAYATLDDPVVADIAGLMPEAKIIYLLRDPIERAWSNLFMQTQKGSGPPIDDMSTEELVARLSRPKIFRHGDYVANLERWERHFAPGQIMVGFYDELAESPELLLRKIYGFLGIDDATEHVPRDAGHRRNARFSGSIPENVMPALARAYHRQLSSLHQRFANRHTGAWLATAERYLNRPEERTA